MTSFRSECIVFLFLAASSWFSKMPVALAKELRASALPQIQVKTLNATAVHRLLPHAKQGWDAPVDNSSFPHGRQLQIKFPGVSEITKSVVSGVGDLLEDFFETFFQELIAPVLNSVVPGVQVGDEIIKIQDALKTGFDIVSAATDGETPQWLKALADKTNINLDELKEQSKVVENIQSVIQNAEALQTRDALKNNLKPVGLPRRLENEVSTVPDDGPSRDLRFKETLPISEDIEKGVLLKTAVAGLREAIQPKCGGVLTGDVCAFMTFTLKAFLAAVEQQLEQQNCEKQMLLDEIKAENENFEKDMIRANYDNILFAHDKLNEANDKLDEANDKLDEANEKLDESLVRLNDIQCPIAGSEREPADLNTVPIVRGQGCDTVDQDCDGRHDECKEDRTPPEIILDVELPDAVASDEEFIEFLRAHLRFTDDCAQDLGTPTITKTGPGCFDVTVEDQLCRNDEEPGAFTATRQFCTTVDVEGPTVRCGFFAAQNEFHVRDGNFDPSSGQIPPFPLDGEPLHLDASDFFSDPVDVELFYEIADNEGGKISADIIITSNEIEGFTPNDNEMAYIVERVDKADPQDADQRALVHRAEVYLAPFTCQSRKSSKKSAKHGLFPSNKGKGGRASRICRTEPGVSTRFYDIEIVATDGVGNVSNAICTVIVVPSGHYRTSKSKKSGNGKAGTIRRDLQGVPGNSHPSSKSKKSKSSKSRLDHPANDLRQEYVQSSQRYKIAKHSLEWDSDLNTAPLTPPPPPPQPSSKSKSSKSSNFLSADLEAEMVQP